MLEITVTALKEPLFFLEKKYFLAILNDNDNGLNIIGNNKVLEAKNCYQIKTTSLCIFRPFFLIVLGLLRVYFYDYGIFQRLIHTAYNHIAQLI